MNDKKMNKKVSIFTSIFITIVLLVVSVVSLFPLLKNINFGLDLAGGFEVLYKVESLDGKKVTSDMVNSTYKIIEKRVNSLGVSEPVITVEGNNIRVQLAGIKNADEARNTISQVGSLTFRDTDNNLLMTSDVLESGKASVATNQKTGAYEISLQIKDKDTFYKVTKKISEQEDNYITIWLDYEEGVDSYYHDNNGNKTREACGDLKNSHCLSAATVSQGFASDVVIQGNFSRSEAQSLVDLINSGSMPTKLEEISSRSVTASFGADSLDKTLVASIVGIAAIIVLMILLYKLSGFIASVGIMGYTALTILIFNLVGGKLTLQGIAALVIGIGMAVDSSVISFSRIKEELKKGSGLTTAFKVGTKQSIMSIVDANLTTLLAAIILFIFGESSVKGFATMLIISIVVTFIVMVFILRFLLSLFVRSDKFNNHRFLFIGYRNKENKKKGFTFDFIKYRKVVFVLVSLLIVAGGIFTYTKGLNLGVDFKGGSSITITADKINKNSISKDIKKLNYKVDSIEQINDETVYVTIQDVLSNEKTKSTEEYFNNKYSATTSVGTVSNVVKRDLTMNAIKALIIAIIGIIVYISIRFKFSYAISSIVALIHDSVLVLILFAFLHLEISSIFIAAILAIIGYSINNTIVVFDRVRENKKKLYNNTINKKEDLEDIINTSLNQTVVRCIITTITTMLPVLSLIFLGSYEILNFNLALLFGLIVGTFSSLFLAPSIWYMLEKRKIGKPKKRKWYEEDPKKKKKEPEELKIKGVNC